MDLRNLSLVDGLDAMIRAFDATRDTGMTMTRKNVAVMIDGLRSMRDEAKHLETIADRAQWNERAKRDAQRACRDELAAAISDGKVALFPVIARPTAGRRDEGGAA